MKTLYAKLMVLVGSVFAVILVSVVVYVYVAGRRQIEREWTDRARTLNRVAFEALYANLLHGGGREGSRRVLSRLEEAGAFARVWVVKGDSVIQEYGLAPDELPQDDLDFRGLAGEEVSEIRREGGFSVIRQVTPLRLEAECQSCHQAPPGTMLGAISTEISLREEETALRQRRDLLLAVCAGGLVVLGVIAFAGLRRLVTDPLHRIRQGTSAIARGDLDHRLDVRTGDELESLAQAFNSMAERLQLSYGRLAEEQGKLLAAIEASQDAIWLTDTSGRLLLANAAMEPLVGVGKDDLVGQACRDVLRLQDGVGGYVCDFLCPYLSDARASGRIEGALATPEGEELWVEISYSPIVDPNGRPVGMVHIVHDVTHRKEVDRLKDEFITMVSHELRTPLGHIKGFATTLLQTDVEWDAASERDFLSSINREADRLSDLVDKILHLSRLEAGALPMDREWHRVEDLLNGALQRRRDVTTTRLVDVRLPPELPLLHVDGREVEVVLMNLLENAAKYSDPGTRITLAVRHVDRAVVFTVADRGPGIPAEHLGRIFERFHRVETPGRRVSGTGLGLAICKRVVEAHGGRIWVESAPGEGSCFHFSLPVDRLDDGSV